MTFRGSPRRQCPSGPDRASGDSEHQRLPLTPPSLLPRQGLACAVARRPPSLPSFAGGSHSPVSYRRCTLIISFKNDRFHAVSALKAPSAAYAVSSQTAPLGKSAEPPFTCSTVSRSSCTTQSSVLIAFDNHWRTALKIRIYDLEIRTKCRMYDELGVPIIRR